MKKIITALSVILLLSGCGSGESNPKPLTAQKPPVQENNKGTVPVPPNPQEPDQSKQAEACMRSLEQLSGKYKEYMENEDRYVRLYSVLTSERYLNLKYGIAYTDKDQTELEQGNEPLPVYFSEDAQIKLIYPDLGYTYTSVQMKWGTQNFKQMVKSFKGKEKPWEVDGSLLKKLPGCAVLPFSDIKSSVAGAGQKSEGPDHKTTYAYDYVNTLNMWMDDEQAGSQYENERKKLDRQNEETGMESQFVYLYLPDQKVDSLIMEDSQANKFTQIKFHEVENKNGGHRLQADIESSPWRNASPFLYDDSDGYSRFILEADGHKYILTNHEITVESSKLDDVFHSLAGTYYAGDAMLEILPEKNGKLTAHLSYGTGDLSKIAEAELSGKWAGNQMNFTFDGDG